MTAHDHRTLVPGCYRCELDKDEIAHAFATTRYVVAQEPPCRCGSEDCRTYDLDEIATLPVMRPGDSVRVTMTDDGKVDVVPLVQSAAAKDAWGAEMWVDAPEPQRSDTSEASRENDR